jgi:hypothetical protein
MMAGNKEKENNMRSKTRIMRRVAEYHVSDVETMKIEIIHAGLAEWDNGAANVLRCEGYRNSHSIMSRICVNKESQLRSEQDKINELSKGE